MSSSGWRGGGGQVAGQPRVDRAQARELAGPAREAGQGGQRDGQGDPAGETRWAPRRACRGRWPWRRGGSPCPGAGQGRPGRATRPCRPPARRPSVPGPRRRSARPRPAPRPGAARGPPAPRFRSPRPTAPPGRISPRSRRFLALSGAASITARAIAARSPPESAAWPGPAPRPRRRGPRPHRAGRWRWRSAGPCPGSRCRRAARPGAGQVGVQVPGRARQLTARNRYPPSAFAIWSAVNSASSGAGFRRESSAADRQLAGGGVGLDPVPGAHGCRLARPRTLRRGRHPQRPRRPRPPAARSRAAHPAPSRVRTRPHGWTTRRGRPGPSLAGPGRAARGGRRHGEQVIRCRVFDLGELVGGERSIVLVLFRARAARRARGPGPASIPVPGRDPARPGRLARGPRGR